MSEAQQLLDELPGWAGATVSELDGGLTNRTWLVEKGSRKAVLKIDEKPRSAPYNTRPAEAHLQSIAANHGLANSVLYFDDRAIMSEYLRGYVWEMASFELEDNIERLASLLRRLHALPLTGRSFDSQVAAGRYAERIETSDTALVEHCKRVIDRFRLPHNLCCCHNDLVAANIIEAQGLKFLDWEYACDNDPMFDLATVVEHHVLDEAIAFRLLDAYFDGDGKRWRSKLVEQQELYRALCWLWLASRPERNQADLDAIAARMNG
jgi:thiamine kinase